MNFARYGIASALSSLLVAGCFNASARNERPADAVVIQGAGSTFAAPLYRKWIEAYRQSSPKVWVEYDSVGSGEGQVRFVEGTVDFGASDTLLSAEQAGQVEGGFVSVPVAAGGIALAYNSADLPDGLKLPRDVYPAIFLGQITRWDDSRIAAANPGVKLPNIAIELVVRSDSSGTTNAFTSHLSAISQAWRSGPGSGKAVSWPKRPRQMPGNERVAGAITQVHGGIGYVEYGLARAVGLHTAAVENKSGEFVRPSIQSIQAAVAGLDEQHVTDVDPTERSAYPIVTNTWLFLRKKPQDAKRAAELLSFVKWCLADGQSGSEALGYVPPAAEKAAAAQKLVAELEH